MGGVGPAKNGPVAYIVMGVCGSGKSTIATEIAKAKRIELLDADDFHPRANLEKMGAGVALSDGDRSGWLDLLNRELAGRLGRGASVVLACSALKQGYRDKLSEGLPQVSWLYLRGDRETILERMRQRGDHFMPPTLIVSQLQTLEEPEGAVVVDIRLPVAAIVAKSLAEL